MTSLVIAEALAIFLLGVLVVGLLRSHAEILRSLHDLGAGVGDPSVAGRRAARGQDLVLDPRGGMTASGEGAAHDVVGRTLDDAAAAIAVTGVRHDTLLAFLSSGCGTCVPFWEAFREGAPIPGSARLVVVTQSEESESRLRSLAGPNLTIVRSSAAWEAYEVPGSPHFVYVHGPSGRIVGEGTGSSWPQVAGLLAQASDDAAARTSRASHARDNAARIDAELNAAGIGPGHPSLFLSGEPE